MSHIKFKNGETFKKLLQWTHLNKTTKEFKMNSVEMLCDVEVIQFNVEKAIELCGNLETTDINLEFIELRNQDGSFNMFAAIATFQDYQYLVTEPTQEAFKTRYPTITHLLDPVAACEHWCPTEETPEKAIVLRGITNNEGFYPVQDGEVHFLKCNLDNIPEREASEAAYKNLLAEKPELANANQVARTILAEDKIPAYAKEYETYRFTADILQGYTVSGLLFAEYCLWGFAQNHENNPYLGKQLFQIPVTAQGWQDVLEEMVLHQDHNPYDSGEEGLFMITEIGCTTQSLRKRKNAIFSVYNEDSE